MEFGVLIDIWLEFANKIYWRFINITRISCLLKKASIIIAEVLWRLICFRPLSHYTIHLAASLCRLLKESECWNFTFIRQHASKILMGSCPDHENESWKPAKSAKFSTAGGVLSIIAFPIQWRVLYSKVAQPWTCCNKWDVQPPYPPDDIFLQFYLKGGCQWSKLSV